ncbi:MAG: M14/M99 family metallopeptidase [Desulfobacteraceae bacterium]
MVFSENSAWIFAVKNVWIRAILVFFLASGTAVCQKTHTVFYEGSENELHVYRVYGDKPGKTLLLIGGIQGDEPGGFLAADLYADFSLEKGNLIVVPRANFPSILQKRRQINQDMNRTFADDNIANYEAKVVKVLKQLIHESDCLLNLHEGSGFFSETIQGPMRNPERFGQSIIADTDSFVDQEKELSFNLRKMAENVIRKINAHITDPDHFFHFNNHNTKRKDSRHKEQRKSATYYALYTCRIPAFGIESAKSLPLEQKVRQHIYAINGFMELLDIIPETPGVDLKTPELNYMVVSVNESLPFVVENRQRLSVEKGDIIQIHNIDANYERGLSADILGFGSRFNDMQKKIRITRPTRVVAKKDFYPCGSIYLDFSKTGTLDHKKMELSSAAYSTRVKKYRLKVNNSLQTAEPGDHVTLKYGDILEIEDIVTGGMDPSKYIVNFKGFVGNRTSNSGEDRGFQIKINRNVLMKRYSLKNQGRHYVIVVTLDNKEVSRLYIDVQP